MRSYLGEEPGKEHLKQKEPKLLQPSGGNVEIRGIGGQEESRENNENMRMSW